MHILLFRIDESINRLSDESIKHKTYYNIIIPCKSFQEPEHKF